MTFKQNLERDLDTVFLNLAEFAETVTLDGAVVPAIVDYEDIEFSAVSDARLGVVYDAVTLRLKKVDLPGRYQPGVSVEFQGERWQVYSCNGMQLAELRLYKERGRCVM